MSSTPLIIGVTDQDSNFFISTFALSLKGAELLLSLQLFVLLIIVMIIISIITVHNYYNQYIYMLLRSNRILHYPVLSYIHVYTIEMFWWNKLYDSCYLQKTVVAVLDQMLNPHWPYLPQRQENYETEKEREAIEGVWNTISDDPLNYHFYYHILDGDEEGGPPKIVTSDGHQQMENKYFNWKDKSCLQAIAKSNNKVNLNLKKKKSQKMQQNCSWSKVCNVT